MITQIDFDTELNIPGPSTVETRRRIIRQHTIQRIRKLFAEKGAEKGQQWDFTAKVTGTLINNGKLIDDYTDKFSLTV